MMHEKQNEILETSTKPAGTNAIVDLSAPGIGSLIARRVLADIDAYCVDNYNDGHRKHLGASLIGRACKRELWFVFRWVKETVLDGRRYRLFNRGHREEDRFIEWLRGVGFTVYTHDESQPQREDGTYPQFRVAACGGHFGGSLDGIAYFPAAYNIPEPILLEFKTHGTGAGFNNLCSHGMAVEKAEHYAQTSVYGVNEKYRFRYVLYLSINKNDDSIHCELVALDWNLGEQMVFKAEGIITSPTPPPRISNQATYTKCNYCDFKDVCHEGAQIEVNCRSCKYASPIDGGNWHCSYPAHNATIPGNIIPVGCGYHIPITLENA